MADRNTAIKIEKEELIRIEDLWVEYRSGGAVSKAVNGLNLTINKGEA